MPKYKIRTLAVAGITIVGAALATLGTTTVASAAPAAASAPAHVTAQWAAKAAADPSGCVTEDFSEADEGTYEPCVRDEQVLLNNLWSVHVLPGLKDLTVDGYYGPDTTSDVYTFQGDLAITYDGVTGPQTWWWVCHINSNAGFTGTYWHDAGCATETASPPS